MATDKSRSGGEGRPSPGRRPRGSSEAAERVVQKIDDRLARTAAQLDRKAAQIDRKAAQLERVSAKLQGHQEMLERISGTLGALAVWTRDEPAVRKPRFSREEIAAEAVRLADAEGLGAVSMRRLASELGAGTMTLYHYVRTKDELLALVVDAVMGEVLVPPGQPLPEDWRRALSVVAGRSRAALRRHPWLLDLAEEPAIGPNSVRHFDQTLQAVASLPGDLTTKLDIVRMVDDYVFGHCLQERTRLQAEEAGDHPELTEYVAGLVTSGDCPQLAALAEEMGFPTLWDRLQGHGRDEERFERNLARLLDGIAANLPTGPDGAAR